jgi:hypothetical protein
MRSEKTSDGHGITRNYTAKFYIISLLTFHFVTSPFFVAINIFQNLTRNYDFSH